MLPSIHGFNYNVAFAKDASCRPCYLTYIIHIYQSPIRQGGRLGVTTARQLITSADDTTLITKEEQEMAELIDRVEQVSVQFRLKLNRQIAKLLVIDQINKPATAQFEALREQQNES